MDGAGQGLRARQAQADAVGLGRDLPALGAQKRHRLGREPVGAGAEHHVQHHVGLQRRQVFGRGFGQADDGAVRHGPHGQHVASGQRGRADAGQGVGGAAAQHGLHGEAAAHRHIAAQAGVGLAHGEHVAVGQAQRLPAVDGPVAACGIGQRERAGGSGDGDHGVATAFQTQAATDGFQAGLRDRIAHEAIGGAAGGLVHGAGGGHALPRLAVPAQILEQGLQTGAQHLQSRALRG